MNKGIKKTGTPSWEELKASPGLPDEDRLEKGPVAFIECVQEIPCNPCEEACPFNAIEVGTPITNLPKLNGEKCTGCGLCIAACPGLAIFRVHKNYTDSTSLVEFPFEYYPLPEEGETVNCVNREGKFITKGRVVRVRNPERFDSTPLITVEIPKEFYLEVRSMERKRCKGC
ncbi:Electron transport complex subunit RsxB [Koleobacter methoxysyntrophicus]|uniref:Electron transport complex subunit RsxB n=1 Tax=Koleobacter methoxysyntrophicus TaxID=2751313 RepID=A0A8A0RLP0_9FIRM|nr:4Fe-4S binding protein [Koleobacter methoxysyntrophicus]QSQ08377.1 Electron transport complex subunit RsxB [Koleobacter methoxysyntrophicus]